MNFNRKTFFDKYREKFGSLDQSQVDGLEFLLGAIEEDPKWESVQQASYFLATVQHETARTFQPIKEFREKRDSPRRANQDRYWLSGFYGRGYVQITWKKNYEKFGIADEPDKALEPETAYRIASKGMREGLFTGLSIDDFINEDKTDYVNARKVVNGLDKANEIAKNAKNFEAVLTDAAEKEARLHEPENGIVTGDSGEEQKVEPPAATQTEPKPEVLPVEAPKTSVTTKVAAGTGAITGIGTALSALGIKIGGVEITTGGLLGLLLFASVCVIVAAVLWDRSQERRERRQARSMDNLADRNRDNVIAAGSKV